MIRQILHIIRWPNLLMVLLVQGLVYITLVRSENSVLQTADLLLLSLVTMLIAASGYVINDYYDYQIDLINRPDQWIAGNTLPLSVVLKLYRYLVVLGALISLLLAFRLYLLPFLAIYPIVIGALWLYSYRLKCMPVLGNVWVSLFCAGVVWVVALPDYIAGGSSVVAINLLYYGLFAFLGTWYREIAKDIEDVEGDRAHGCRTLVVRFGARPGKYLALVLVLLLIAAVYQWMLLQTTERMEYALTVLQGFIVTSMAFVWWAKEKMYYRIASLLIKVVMLLGTIVLLLL